MIISAAFADKINAVLTPQQCDVLARHAGKSVGARVRALRFVWRINKTGVFVAVSPLIDADVCVQWRDGSAHVDGDAALLRVLSDTFAAIDWAALAASLFGATAAPRLLYAIEKTAESMSRRIQRRTASAEDIADYGVRVRHLHKETLQLARTVSRLRLDERHAHP